MPRLLLAVAALAALSGCAGDHRLATCKGPLVALNAPDWQPTPIEMAALAKACPEDK